MQTRTSDVESTKSRRLVGKRCLVTGAGRGAGWGIALELADAGADVAVCDLDAASAAETARQVAEAGVKSLHSTTDVTDEAAVAAMINRVVSEFGGLDVLVNTVAYIDPPTALIDLPLNTWQLAVKTNIDSVFLCSKYAIKAMIPNRSGLIVNISSVNGTRGFPYRLPYGATKAAIINMTETIAMEYRESGIRANCLVPGGIQGPRANILRELAEKNGVPWGTNVPRYDPPVEMLDPRQLGKYIVFLASEDGKPINAQALWIGEGPRMGNQGLY